MKIKVILYIIFIVATVACKKPLCPQPKQNSDTDTTKYSIVLQPGSEGKDALLSNVYATQNFGPTTYLHARAWTSNGDLSLEKGIIQFDYSSIPAGATITKATLTFFADTTVNTGSVGHSQLTGSNDWVLKRVTQAWSESTVTWDTEPTSDFINAIYCQASTSAHQAYNLDVTVMVKDEIANPAVYHGFLMQINDNNPYRAINFCSSDNKYPQLHPKMVIEYTK